MSYSFYFEAEITVHEFVTVQELVTFNPHVVPESTNCTSFSNYIGYLQSVCEHRMSIVCLVFNSSFAPFSLPSILLPDSGSTLDPEF